MFLTRLEAIQLAKEAIPLAKEAILLAKEAIPLDKEAIQLANEAIFLAEEAIPILLCNFNTNGPGLGFCLALGLAMAFGNIFPNRFNHQTQISISCNHHLSLGHNILVRAECVRCPWLLAET